MNNPFATAMKQLMRHAPGVDPAVEDRILELRRRGLLVKEIREAVGMEYGRVRAVLIFHGVNGRGYSAAIARKHRSHAIKFVAKKMR